jgi:serine/threonine-protein kinase
MNVVLRVTEGPYQGREYVFERASTFVVGRSSRAEFSVPDDAFLSRNHFQIELDPPYAYLRDLGSTNGTRVNGVRVTGSSLRNGDFVQAGCHVFQLKVDLPEGAVRCLGCDAPAPPGRLPSIVSGTLTIAGERRWLCEACATRQRQFPTPPQGYWIEARIGGGGMGEVYRARRLEDNRPVAIKMMSQAIASSDKARLYFRRELEVLRDLRHPHIVAFHDMVEVDEQLQLIMEYVDGKDAKRWVQGLPGPLSVPSAARIGVQLLMALDHAHGKGYVHRDIKPSNLIVYGPPSRPTAKLSDFGLAKSVLGTAGLNAVTDQGDIGGSVGFLSPDHIRDFREVKAPADIYSAGATLYYLFTGHYPYFEFDPRGYDAFSMILEHPAVPPRVHRPDTPELLDQVLRKSLEKWPGERWSSAAEMASALRPLLDAPTTAPDGTVHIRAGD